MEKIPENISPKDQEYDLLKQEILNGKVSLEEVRDKLIEFDQSSPSRDASESNLKFLLDRSIVDYVHEHPEVLDGYNRLLSFTEFHVAQRLSAVEPIEAIRHFEEAVRVAQKGGDESWISYVQGSLLYMQNQEIPENIIAKVQIPRNAEILRNLNSGLRERGVPSYMEDYTK